MLLVLLALIAQTPSVGLVFENSSRAHFSNGPEGVTLRQGPGWLRLPNVMLDYELTFEYRLSDQKADAGVIVRSWASPRSWPEGGYRVRLPAVANFEEGKALLSGHRANVETIRQPSSLGAAATGGWRRIQIKAIRQRVSVSVDRADGGEYEIESLAGYVLFDVRKGAVELRGISVKDYEDAGSLGPFPSIASATDAGITMPVPIFEQKPEYTSQAMRKRIEGIVEVQAVVRADGTVGDTRVVRKLDPDLDRAALAAVRLWRFRPATRGGANVPVLVIIELSFTLRTKR